MSAWEIIIRVTDVTEDEAEALYDRLWAAAADVHGSESLVEGDVREVHGDSDA
jgi:hypothetical protein